MSGLWFNLCWLIVYREIANVSSDTKTVLMAAKHSNCFAARQGETFMFMEEQLAFNFTVIIYSDVSGWCCSQPPVNSGRCFNTLDTSLVYSKTKQLLATNLGLPICLRCINHADTGKWESNQGLSFLWGNIVGTTSPLRHPYYPTT